MWVDAAAGPFSLGGEAMRNNPYAVPEVSISVMELYALVEALGDASERTWNPRVRVSNEDLSDRLLHLWSYWQVRCDEPENFMLRIKR